MISRAAREEARTNLSLLGKTLGDLARELNVGRETVRGVLAGTLRAEYGDAHKVAVALGLKKGMIVPEDGSIAEAVRAAAR